MEAALVPKEGTLSTQSQFLDTSCKRKAKDSLAGTVVSSNAEESPKAELGGARQMNQVTLPHSLGGNLCDFCPLSFDNCYETLTSLFPILSFFDMGSF